MMWEKDIREHKPVKVTTFIRDLERNCSIGFHRVVYSTAVTDVETVMRSAEDEYLKQDQFIVVEFDGHVRAFGIFGPLK